MKSNLFKQLEQLKQNQTARDLKTNRYASLIFDFQQAANFDSDTIKSIGLQGLDSLIVQDPSLQILKEKIFSPEYDRLQREKLTVKENEAVSDLVKSAINQLAKFFLLEDCHKVIEYLLRNFEPHKYEANSLIIAFMPYHSTVYYVKLLQNIDLAKTKHWFFLEKNVKEGLIIPRELIAKQCTLDFTILDEVIKFAKEGEFEEKKNTDVFFAVAGNSNQGKIKPQKNLAVTFAMLLAIETIGYAKDKRKINENLLISLIKFLAFCLKHDNPDIFRSGLILALQLVSSVTLTTEYLKAISADANKKFTNKTFTRDILLLNIFIHQNNEAFPMSDLFEEIKNHPLVFFPIFLELASQYSILTFFLAFYKEYCSAYIPTNSSKDLANIFPKMLELVLRNDSKFAEAQKRNDFAILLMDTLLSVYIEKANNISEKERESLINHLAHILKSIKIHLPDSITNALQNLIANSQLVQDNIETVSKLLEKNFSKLYLESVLGIESQEALMTADLKTIMTNLSPFTPSPLTTKLKALEYIQENISKDDLENTNTTQALQSILIMNFNSHSYNEKFLIALLDMPVLVLIAPAKIILPNLFNFLRIFYKYNNKDSSKQLLEKIFAFIFSHIQELESDSLQAFKDLVMETTFSERTWVLKQYTKELQGAFPIIFKSASPDLFENQTDSQRVEKIGVAMKIEDLSELMSEVDKSKTDTAKELLLLVGVYLILKLSENYSNPPQSIALLFERLKKLNVKRLQSFVEIIASNMSNLRGVNLKTEQRKGLYLILESLITFLLGLKDTKTIPALKEVFNIFQQDKLRSIVLIMHRTQKNSKEFLILCLFLQKIIENENSNLNELAHTTLLLLPLLCASDHQPRKQVFNLIKTIQAVASKKASEDTFSSAYRVYLDSPFIELTPIQDNDKSNKLEIIFEVAKSLTRMENEILSAESSQLSSFLCEKLAADILINRDLLGYFIEDFYNFPIIALLNFAIDFLSTLNTKYSDKILDSSAAKTLLENSQLFIKSTQNLVLVERVFVLASSLQVLNSKPELLRVYYDTVYRTISNLATADNQIGDCITKYFPANNVNLLEEDYQIEYLQNMFNLVHKGSSTASIIKILSQSNLPSKMLNNYGFSLLKLTDETKYSKLILFSEVLRSLGKKQTEFLKLFAEIYRIIVEQGFDYIKKIGYALTIFISIHKDILTQIIESKTTVDYNRVNVNKEEKANKKNVPLYRLTGEYREEKDSYDYLISLSELLQLILQSDNYRENLDKSYIFGSLKEIFGCLATYSYFIFNKASSMVTISLMQLFNRIEDENPKTQLAALRLFSEVISTSSKIFEELTLQPYIPLLLKLLSLQAKNPSFTNNPKNYNYIEIDKEISSIIKIIGEKNIEYIIYAIINNILLENSSKESKKKLMEGGTGYDNLLSSGLSLIFASQNLEESLKILNKLLSNNYDMISYYLIKAMDLKKGKQVMKPGSATHGKKISNNFGIKSIQGLKYFALLNIDLWKRAFQSKQLLSLLSDFLIKGNIQKEVIQQICLLLIGLIDIKNLIAYFVSKIQAQKNLKENDPVLVKKRAQLKSMLKQLTDSYDESLQNYQEIFPEEIQTLVATNALSATEDLKIKTKILENYYDKVTFIQNPKINNKSALQLKEIVERNLKEYASEESLPSIELIAFIQSLFLVLNVLIKKKHKIFEAGIHESVFKYTTSPSLEIKCSALYTICLYNEKYGTKNLENLHDFMTQLAKSMLTSIKLSEPENYEKLRSFSSEQAKAKQIGEIINEVDNTPINEVRDLESCFVLCLNSSILLVESYKDLLHPYMLSLLASVGIIISHEERIEQLLELITENIEPRNLIEPVGILAESQHKFTHEFASRIAILIGKICSKLDADTFESRNQIIFKIFIKGFDYARLKYQENDNISREEIEIVEKVQSNWVDAFSKFAIKTNEVQLKKFFLKLNEWSSKVFKEEDAKFSILRKIVIFELMIKLFDTIKSYFVPYMSFVFDFCLDQLTHYAQVYSTPHQKGSKRKMIESDISLSLEYKLHCLILDTMRNCFIHDKEEFIDTNKFDKIINPLIDQLDCIGVPTKYDQFVALSVQPAVLQLFELVKDDYKWKSLNYSLMMKTRSEITSVKLATLNIVLRMVEQLKERVAVLVNDILSFVAETLEDENIEVEKVSKEIVMKLEQITGEDIKEYLK